MGFALGRRENCFHEVVQGEIANQPNRVLPEAYRLFVCRHVQVIGAGF